MPTGQVSGLASGINWQETIQLIMQIESQPKVALEDRKQVYENKLAAWQALNTKLLALKTSMDGLNELDEILTKAASSTEQDILTASATSSAATGSYSVLVNKLALGDKVTHGGFADANTTAITTTDGTFTYQYGTGAEAETITVDVPAGSTLTELAAAINNDVNNPGIVATILNDGGSLNPPFHLILSGETGAANVIPTANIVCTNLTNFTNTFTQTQIAQDAEIRVDGYPPSTWILSSDNDVSDVIAGVVLHLHSADPTSAAVVTVSNDTNAASTKIQDFVTAYNEVVNLINADTVYNADSETAGTLFGDASVIAIKSNLQTIIASAVPGLQENAAFQSLSEIGVKTGAGGQLSVNSTKLNAALQDNFNAVGDLFAFTSSSTNNNLSYFLSSSATQGGVYSVVANYDGSGNLLSATLNGREATIDGDYIIGMEGNPEAGLRIKFTDPGNGPGTLSADVNIGTGSAVEIANKISFLTDPMDGTVHFAEEGIQDTIDSIDIQIENWDTRLAAKQAQLEREFLSMESMISKLNGQSNYVSSMLSQL
jgi:flagellar hook-associated protein 2